MNQQQIKFAIAAQAAAAGIFYQDAYEAFCAPLFKAEIPAVDFYLSDFPANTSGPEEWRIRDREAEALLSAMLRGSWVILTHQRTPTWVTYEVMMSKGDGTVHRCHRGKSDTTFAEAYADLLRMDIYNTRKEFELAQRVQSARNVVQANGWRAGTVLKNIRVDGQRYSTATITSVTSDGAVKLLASRQGSPKRWEIHVLACGITLPAPADVAAGEAAAVVPSPTAFALA